MDSDFINIIDSDQGRQINFIDSRYYTRDNEHFYPGVTNILSTISKGKAYENWLRSNGFNSEILAERAMKQGSNVHHAIEELLNLKEVTFATSDRMNYTRQEWVMIARFIDFYTEFKPRTIGVEKVLVSDILQYGTAIDYVCYIGDDMWLIDHKTGSIYDSASMQVAASIQLWNEYFPENPVTRGGILHLDSAHRGRDKSGKKIQGEGWILSEITDLDKNWQDFQAIHQIWKRQNPDYKPFNLTYPNTYKIELNVLEEKEEEEVIEPTDV